MYSIKNLKLMIKNNFAVFIIFIITVFISLMVILFGIGLYYEYEKKLEDKEIDSYFVGFSFNDIIEKREIKEFIRSVPTELFSDVSYITCFSETQLDGIEDVSPMVFYMQFNDDRFEYSDIIFDPMVDDQIIRSGSFFTQEQYAGGEKSAIIMGDGYAFAISPAPTQGSTITAFGQEYKVIGVMNPKCSNYMLYSCYVPFDSIPEDTQMNEGLFMGLNKKITHSEYDSFTAAINDFFGDRVSVIEPDIDLKSDYSYYTTVIMITAGISLLSILNIYIIYNYIIMSRKRQLAIFRLHGGRLIRLCVIAANEILILTLIMSILAAVVYSFAVLPVLAQRFTIIKSAVSPAGYVIIILTYCIMAYAVNFGLIYKNLKKEGGFVCI